MACIMILSKRSSTPQWFWTCAWPPQPHKGSQVESRVVKMPWEDSLVTKTLGLGLKRPHPMRSPKHQRRQWSHLPKTKPERNGWWMLCVATTMQSWANYKHHRCITRYSQMSTTTAGYDCCTHWRKCSNHCTNSSTSIDHRFVVENHLRQNPSDITA